MTVRSNPAKTAVVIPYFQRESGILRRALLSVGRQRNVDDIRIVVVDDGSPAPASVEVGALQTGFPFAIDVVSQSNGGPGAARNHALDGLPPAVRYVAFLDSDDEWVDDHLANARDALAAGFDVYFSDLTQLQQSVGAFARAGRIRPAEHPTIAGKEHLHRFVGDMVEQILVGNVIGTSTVVFDFQRMPEVRFRPELRHAGEDYLFWIELAARGARFAFSDRIEATYGKGVNVYSGAGWGTEMHLVRVANELQYYRLCRREFRLSRNAQQALQGRTRDLRVDAIRDLLHRVRQGKPPPLAWVKDIVRSDPKIMLMCLPIALRIAAERT
jgi:succinoglycan biosynthesis protein ExoW